MICMPETPEVCETQNLIHKSTAYIGDGALIGPHCNRHLLTMELLCATHQAAIARLPTES
jgi:hypothetical protein